MISERNSLKEIKMRRYQNLLTVSGLGVIVFGVWSILKTILIFSASKEFLKDLPDDTTAKVIIFAIAGALVLIDALMRIFAGLSARSEGFGKKKKGYAYVVVAMFMALLSLLYLASVFFTTTSDASILEIIVSVVVEAMSLIVTIELIVAAFTVKKLKKELGEV